MTASDSPGETSILAELIEELEEVLTHIQDFCKQPESVPDRNRRRRKALALVHLTLSDFSDLTNLSRS